MFSLWETNTHALAVISINSFKISFSELSHTLSCSSSYHSNSIFHRSIHPRPTSRVFGAKYLEYHFAVNSIRFDFRIRIRITVKVKLFFSSLNKFYSQQQQHQQNSLKKNHKQTRAQILLATKDLFCSSNM